MKLDLTDQEILIVGDALMEAPFKKVAAVLQKIQQQINEQQKPKVEVNSGGESEPNQSS